MSITKVKCWYIPGAILDKDSVEKSEPTLSLVKKSMLKAGYRAYCLTDRIEIEKSAWYSDYLAGDQTYFYIEGSGVFRLVNIDLVENEFYFEKSNIPAGFKPWIFFSWQSDYNPSRSHIKDAIKKAIETINSRNPKVPVEIVESTRDEDGSGDIVEAIKKNIDRSLCCVFDITNVSTVPAKNVEESEQDTNVKLKDLPNANVAFELGYALCRKVDSQVFLVKKTREDLNEDNCPFDFDKRKRIKYNNKTEVVTQLSELIIKHFEKIGYIEPQQN
ncbi:MAG: hypothetical protein CL561_01715 [Alphaproteobacteria bacterium]|nr:hypothetical protein [Alphaproteobacteria bacterium]|tara:strand:+ start:1808 stop:2629 length:822 start_codon:yes stop_codon:yes gene_type:complete